MEDIDDNDVFYFVAFVNKRKALTVIDLAYAVDYEKNDWDVASKETFEDPEKACRYARALAEKYGLEYRLFDSRYNEDLSEKLTLDLDEGEAP